MELIARYAKLDIWRKLDRWTEIGRWIEKSAISISFFGQCVRGRYAANLYLSRKGNVERARTVRDEFNALATVGQIHNLSLTLKGGEYRFFSPYLTDITGFSHLHDENDPVVCKLLFYRCYKDLFEAQSDARDKLLCLIALEQWSGLA